ncbi:MAG: hypothetical protein AAF802_15210 [Planctomycetota bacterium]
MLRRIRDPSKAAYDPLLLQSVGKLWLKAIKNPSGGGRLETGFDAVLHDQFVDLARKIPSARFLISNVENSNLHQVFIVYVEGSVAGHSGPGLLCFYVMVAKESEPLFTKSEPLSTL